jgi:hypothetical protein
VLNLAQNEHPACYAELVNFGVRQRERSGGELGGQRRPGEVGEDLVLSKARRGRGRNWAGAGRGGLRRRGGGGGARGGGEGGGCVCQDLKSFSICFPYLYIGSDQINGADDSIPFQLYTDSPNRLGHLQGPSKLSALPLRQSTTSKW